MTLSKKLRLIVPILLLGAMCAAPVAVLSAQPEPQTQAAPARAGGGEASLVLPDLSSVSFLSGSIDGHTLLMGGLVISALGLVFGLMVFRQLKNLPVHAAMREVWELIYETSKAY